MKIHIITFLFIVCSFSLATSQNMTMLDIDSLKHALVVASNDTTRVLLMANLTEGYRGSKPDSAIYFAQQALQLAKQIRFVRGEILALLGTSVVMRELGNLPMALDIAQRAQKIAEGQNYTREEAFAFVRIANVYSSLNNIDKALTYLKMAAEKLNRYKGHFLNGAIHSIAGDLLEQTDRLDSALYELDLAVAFALKYDYSVLFPGNHSVYGNIYFKKGNYKLAAQHFHQGIEGSVKLKDFRSISTCFNRMAIFCKNINQKDSAIYYAKQALDYAQVLSYKNQEMRAAKLLSEIYEDSDSKMALHYYKVATEARDSLYSAEKVQALQTLEFEEQGRLRELQTEKLAYRNKLIQNGLLIGASLLIITALVLYRNNKEKQKTNTVLASTLSNLKSTQAQLIQSEKMASLGELTAGIAHEIQNPLNFVNNFSEVSNELIDEMKTEMATGNQQLATEIANDIKQNLEKINHHGKRADAIVKGMLQHSRTSSGVKESTDMNALAEEYLRLAFHGLRAKDKSFNSKFETDFDSSIPTIYVVPQDIGRVILNLITNAFYAVNEKAKQNISGYEPTVVIGTRYSLSPGDGQGEALITVKDNGNGIPDKIKDKIFQPFFTSKPTGQGTGLGLSLSYDIVKSHGGKLTVETTEGEGSAFVIALPVV
jgi:two-component system NtrC family sensor kinase